MRKIFLIIILILSALTNFAQKKLEFQLNLNNCDLIENANYLIDKVIVPDSNKIIIGVHKGMGKIYQNLILKEGTEKSFKNFIDRVLLPSKEQNYYSLKINKIYYSNEQTTMYVSAKFSFELEFYDKNNKLIFATNIEKEEKSNIMLTKRTFAKLIENILIDSLVKFKEFLLTTNIKN